MDGRRIAISKTGLVWYRPAATIGSFLHVLACTYLCTSADTYGCDPNYSKLPRKIAAIARRSIRSKACHL